MIKLNKSKIVIIGFVFIYAYLLNFKYNQIHTLENNLSASKINLKSKQNIKQNNDYYIQNKQLIENYYKINEKKVDLKKENVISIVNTISNNNNTKIISINKIDTNNLYEVVVKSEYDSMLNFFNDLNARYSNLLIKNLDIRFNSDETIDFNLKMLIKNI